jgi:hypothetical protein
VRCAQHGSRERGAVADAAPPAARPLPVPRALRPPLARTVQATLVRVESAVDHTTDEEFRAAQAAARAAGRPVPANRTYDCAWPTPAGVVSARTDDLEALLRRRKLEQRAAEVRAPRRARGCARLRLAASSCAHAPPAPRHCARK